MSVIAKSQSLMRKLKDRLQRRLPSTYVFTESMDSQGAILLISADSSPATGEQVCALRIRGESTQFSDIVGNAQKVYSPSLIQVIEEAGAVAGTSILSLSNKSKIDAEVNRLSVKQERYLNANGTVPAVSQFAADGSVSSSTLNCEISPDLNWPQSGQ